MAQPLNWLNLSNTLWFKNHRKKIRYYLKREGASNRLTEDTAPGNSGERALHSNRWTVRGILLQTILDNWAVFQELWDDILEEKADSEIRGLVIRVETQKQSLNFFFWVQLGVVSMHTDNLSSTLEYTNVMLHRSVNCKSMLFNITREGRGS